MESSYFSSYNIVQTYKENRFQKVYVATDKESREAVVINNIYIKENSAQWELDSQDYKNIFDDIVGFEKNQDEIVIVTRVKEGIPLSEYLEDPLSSLDKKINLMYKYLAGIKRYDSLPDNVKPILVDKSQVIVDDENIYFGELIIFNDENFYVEDFEPTRDNIISTLQNFTSLPHVNYNELPLYIKAVGFIDEVRKDERGTYASIESIFNAFEELNIHRPLDANKKQNTGPYPSSTNLNKSNLDNNIQHRDLDNNLYKDSSSADTLIDNNLDSYDSHRNLYNRDLGPDGLPGQKINSTQGNYFIQGDTGTNRPLTAAIAIAGLATTVLVGMFVFKSILPVNKSIDNNYLGSSNDIVTVGSNNLESNEDSQNNGLKTTDSVNKVFYTSEHIEKDYENFKYNNYSHKITDNKSKGHIISMEQGKIEAGSQFLMWMKSDTNNKVDIALEVYSDDKLTFKQSVLYKPVSADNWELVRFPINKNIDGPFDLVFSNVDGSIWIDKISIDIFK